MNKYTFLILAFLSSAQFTGAQQKCPTFTLQGNINTDSGKIILMSIGNGSYYPYKTNMETNIVKGKFTFTDSISYPCAYLIGIRTRSEWKYISNMFFVDPCTQTIFCNIDTPRGETPVIRNNSMDEYLGNYKKEFSKLNERWVALNQKSASLYKTYKNNIPEKDAAVIKKTKDSIDRENKMIIWQYAKRHPDSYIILWTTSKQLTNGYEPIFDSIYNCLSEPLRNTHTGRELAKKLASARPTAIGNSFLPMELYNINLEKVTLPRVNKNNKYTLVCFWFSHCSACISKFGAYQRLYATYKKAGFEIAGISIDEQKNIDDWRKVIKDRSIFWPQYLDAGGRNTTRMSIDYFTTNFLLDENGVIIKKDITAQELETLLAKELKK